MSGNWPIWKIIMYRGYHYLPYHPVLVFRVLPLSLVPRWAIKKKSSSSNHSDWTRPQPHRPQRPPPSQKFVSPQCSCLMYTIISIFLLNTTYCVLLLVICIVRNKMAVCQLSLCWIIIWICMKRSVKFTWYDYDTNQWKETIVFTLGTLMHWMAIFSNDFIITAMINEMLWSMILIFFPYRDMLFHLFHKPS